MTVRLMMDGSRVFIENENGEKINGVKRAVVEFMPNCAPVLKLDVMLDGKSKFEFIEGFLSEESFHALAISKGYIKIEDQEEHF